MTAFASYRGRPLVSYSEWHNQLAGLAPAGGKFASRSFMYIMIAAWIAIASKKLRNS